MEHNTDLLRIGPSAPTAGDKIIISPHRKRQLSYIVQELTARRFCAAKLIVCPGVKGWRALIISIAVA